MPSPVSLSERARRFRIPLPCTACVSHAILTRFLLLFPQWQPNSDIEAALDDGLYLAFRNVAPTGKRFLLGVDVSGSMDWGRWALQ